MYRPGIDVTQAELIPNLNWRRQERTEMVGNWKAKVYDMLHVMVSVKSRRVPVDEEERLGNAAENDEFDDLESALRIGNSDGLGDDEEPGVVDNQENGSGGVYENGESNGAVKEKKSWFGWKNKGSKNTYDDPEDSKILKKFSNLAPEGGAQKSDDHQKSSESAREDTGDAKKGKDKSSKKKKKKGPSSESKHESEYKKGLRPVLWLTPDFPLKTEELLPLLDILANKVKAIRRLRELLTTKLPLGTFPVKFLLQYLLMLFSAFVVIPSNQLLFSTGKLELADHCERSNLELMNELIQIMKSEKENGFVIEVAIPIVPTVRPSAFPRCKVQGIRGASSWISWMKGSRGGQSSDSDSHRYKDEIDPFLIPSDYTWVDANAKKRRMKAKKARNKKHRRGYPASTGCSQRATGEGWCEKSSFELSFLHLQSHFHVSKSATFRYRCGFHCHCCPDNTVNMHVPGKQQPGGI
ncbi:hypothetical protein NC652_040390 [Populus alba x Populus x berolinensis]|nr:hypothetical protein NC652_040390 [Populus alba x Populus x berolinensis]